MREILFRGKRVDNGEWAYGYLCYVHADCTSSAQIYSSEYCQSYEVLADTVGQYTGVSDEYGVKIFEGDHLKITMPLIMDNPIINESDVFWNGSSWCVHWGNMRDTTRLDDFSHTVTFGIMRRSI